MYTATIAELLDVQRAQLDYHCRDLSEGAAAELRRRIQLKTGVYPRPEIEMPVAYAQVPRGGDIEQEKERLLRDLAEADPISMLGGPPFVPPPSPDTLRRLGIAAHKKLERFMPRSQWLAVKDYMLPTNEEAPWFHQKMCDLAFLIDHMPRVGDQVQLGSKIEEHIVHLHYFRGSTDIYISELDPGAEGDTEECFMGQCFGYGDLFGTGGEFGYFSIPEITKAGTELDFHFTPQSVTQLQRR